MRDQTTPNVSDQTYTPVAEGSMLAKFMGWAMSKAPESRRVWEAEEPPPRGAPFEDYMAYYRSQHTTNGIRATHLVGIPGAAVALPLLVAKPKTGAVIFVGSWLIQVAGHKVFEHNNPAFSKGFFTYQFCGLAFWCEEMGDKAAGR
jgi:uncharacterized membrane protein YGL010W